MNLETHWGAWGAAIVALIVGAALIARARGKKKRNWAATCGLIALVFAVLLFFFGWRAWPANTKQRFISAMFRSEYASCKAMLHEPAQLSISEGGSLTIHASDNTQAALSPDELPLTAGIGDRDLPSRGWEEVLSAREEFRFGTIRRRKCVLHCTAERGKVHIRKVEITEL